MCIKRIFLVKYLNNSIFNLKNMKLGLNNSIFGSERTKSGAGFTLIEFLVVIGIIGLLSVFAMTSVHYARVYAKQKKAYADLATIAKSIDTLALDTGQWPGHQTPYVSCSANCNTNEIEDLTVGVGGIQVTDGLFPNWHGPYIQILSTDPWGTPYFYDSDYEINGQTKAVVGSYGPNKQGLNLYDNDDIVYVISY